MNEAAVSLPPPRGSSFYAAMRILPREKRQAMFDVYGFCRAVDDIADDLEGERPARHAALQKWRGEIDAIYAGRPAPGLTGLARSIAAYDLQRRDFLAVIDGMEMDVAADIRAPDRATLDLYCDRVACAVGRLSTRIFGLEARAGEALADHLGRALQLTNILRDLDEDCALGRLYLPREALEQAGVADSDPAAVLASPSLDKAVRPLVEEAHRRFGLAKAVMDESPRAAVRAPRLMAAAYQAILTRLEKRGFAPPRAAVRISRPRLLLALAWYGLF
jgi:presqualene diphosphate synthase